MASSIVATVAIPSTAQCMKWQHPTYILSAHLAASSLALGQYSLQGFSIHYDRIARHLLGHPNRPNIRRIAFFADIVPCSSWPPRGEDPAAGCRLGGTLSDAQLQGTTR